MLTLFSVPKPFRGPIGAIQRNALASWQLLRPRPEIILCGREEGTAETAREFAVQHLPDVSVNEFGTPLMDSVFAAAQRAGRGPWFAFVNADIILLSDFDQALRRIPFRRFLMTGVRINLRIDGRLDLSAARWESLLRARVAQEGELEGIQALDYFVFPRGVYRKTPALAIGRVGTDNWLLLEALRLGIPVIDASAAILSVHQSHVYDQHPAGKLALWNGPEAQRNRELMGGPTAEGLKLDLAGWRMLPWGPERVRLTREQRNRYLEILLTGRPAARWRARLTMAGFRIAGRFA